MQPKKLSEFNKSLNFFTEKFGCNGKKSIYNEFETSLHSYTNVAMHADLI